MGTGPRPVVRMRRLPRTLLDRDAMLSIGGHMLSTWDIGVERGGNQIAQVAHDAAQKIRAIDG